MQIYELQVGLSQLKPKRKKKHIIIFIINFVINFDVISILPGPTQIFAGPLCKMAVAAARLRAAAAAAARHGPVRGMVGRRAAGLGSAGAAWCRTATGRTTDHRKANKQQRKEKEEKEKKKKKGYEEEGEVWGCVVLACTLLVVA